MLIDLPPCVPADTCTQTVEASTNVKRYFPFIRLLYDVISNGFILQQFESFLLVLIDDLGRNLTNYITWSSKQHFTFYLYDTIEPNTHRFAVAIVL